MTLHNYQVFVSIVEHGTLVGAAHRLNLSPSAISHALASLEANLGFSLFLRTKLGIRITKSGEEMLVAARSVLAAHNRLLQQAAQLEGLEVGSVTIGALSSICAAWIPGIVHGFRSLYPNIEISVEQGGLDDVRTWIAEGKVDIGFITYPAPPGLDSDDLYCDPLICITPRGFKSEGGASMSVSDLRDVSLISQRGDYARDIARLLEQHKIVIKSQMHAIDAASIIAMVESGLGVAVLPALSLARYKYDLDEFQFDPPACRKIILASLGREGLSPAASKMRSYILSSAESF
ncbi:LysR family transcriptional regulator [Pseudomonas putida]|uniref:LysR family transcriptional regulator n=1 Tax=Pseudomonas putida TaxID=303 RepID=UPI00383A0C3A